MPGGLDVSVRGQRALVANLFACDRAITRNVQRATLRAGVKVQQTAKDLAPKDGSDPSFSMYEQIRLVISRGGLAFEVGYNDDDFAAANKPPYFFFQELGFHHYVTGEFIRNPHLEPAYHAEQAGYREGIRRAVVGAIARLPRGR